MRIRNAEQDALVDSNYIECSGYASGIVLVNNPNPISGAPLRIYHNEIKHIGTVTNDATFGNGSGIFVSDRGMDMIYPSGDDGECYARLEGNRIYGASSGTGFEYGIFVNENSANALNVDVIIGGDTGSVSNTITHCYTCLRANGVSRSNIRGNYSTFDNCNVGIDVYGGEAYITGNRFINCDTAIWVRPKGLFAPIATMNNNLFETSNTVVIENDFTVLNASMNWWGSIDPAMVQARAGMNVDYTPYANSPTDIDPTSRFALDSSVVHVVKMPASVQFEKGNTQVDNTELQEAIDWVANNGQIILHGIATDFENNQANWTDKNIKIIGSDVTDSVRIKTVIANATNRTLAFEGTKNFAIIDTLQVLSGKIEIEQPNVRVLSGAKLLGGNANSYIVADSTGYLIAEVATDPITFPLGLGTYAPATLTNSGTPDYFKLRMKPEVIDYLGAIVTAGTPFLADMVDLTWYVEEETPGLSNVTLKLMWNTAEELPGFNRGACMMKQFHGGTWISRNMANAAVNEGGGF
ncbi:MAG: hypothetical protein NZ108_08760, partial [Bacteroidia bacterium]|nr:hypothetical protein [Bacteroidia bacterium]